VTNDEDFFVKDMLSSDTDTKYLFSQHEEQIAGHPKNIVFLLCNTFGAFPPVAKLSSQLAM